MVKLFIIPPVLTVLALAIYVAAVGGPVDGHVVSKVPWILAFGYGAGLAVQLFAGLPSYYLSFNRRRITFRVTLGIYFLEWLVLVCLFCDGPQDMESAVCVYLPVFLAMGTASAYFIRAKHYSRGAYYVRI